MWKQIFKSDYEISDRGEVRNILTKETKRQYNHSSGYLQVSIEGKLYLTHRLLLIVHKPNEEYGLLEVNHKDGNKKNNRIENLEWVTKAENTRHAYQELNHSAARRVYQYDENGFYLNEFYSASEAARQMGCGQVQISEAAKGTYQSAMGFQWSYIKYDKMPTIKVKRYKRKVAKVDKSTLQVIEVYESVSEAARQNSIDQGSITKVCQGLRNTAGGYKWQYFK